jgi:hypothetical protein
LILGIQFDAPRGCFILLFLPNVSNICCYIMLINQTEPVQ